MSVITASNVLTLIASLQRIDSAATAVLPVALNLQVARFHGFKLEVARTQIHFVLRFVCNASIRVSGDDVIGFISQVCDAIWIHKAS